MKKIVKKCKTKLCGRLDKCVDLHIADHHAITSDHY